MSCAAVAAALGMGEALAQGAQTTSETAPPNPPVAVPPNASAATPPNAPQATSPNAPATTSPDAPIAPSPDTPPDGQAEENATGLGPSAMPVEDGSDDIDAETTGAEVATSPLTAERTQEPDAVATEPATIDAKPVLEEDDFDFSDLEAEASDDFMSGPKLDIYGFADFTYQHWIQNIEPEYKPSFAVGNFNVYLATEFGSNWRSLAEVRFLYLPHGALPANEVAGSPINTTTPDHADIQRPLRWGGVEIERVWLEYAFDQLLSVRGGQWLTPYGIWNVDHGSPTIIATYRPYIVGEALFPERQTGLQVHGSGYLGPVRLGYHLTLSNGRGPIDAYADLDANKAVGGRLFVENASSFGNIAFGVSTYVGSYTNSELSIGASGFTSTVLERFDELSYAADLKWVYEGVHLQSEVVVHEVRYDDELRPSDPPAVLTRSGFRVRPFELEVEAEHPFQSVLAYGGAMAYVYLADRSTCVDESATCDWAKPPRFEEDVLVAAEAFFQANASGKYAKKMHEALDMILTRRPRFHEEKHLPFEVYIGGGRLESLESYLTRHPRPTYVKFDARLRDLAVGRYGERAGDILLLANNGNVDEPEQRYYFAGLYHSWHGSPSRKDSEVPFILAHRRRSSAELATWTRAALGKARQQDVTPLLLELLAPR